jgi:hypothetical protein
MQMTDAEATEVVVLLAEARALLARARRELRASRPSTRQASAITSELLEVQNAATRARLSVPVASLSSSDWEGVLEPVLETA